MQTPSLTIGGAPIPFAKAWVHLKACTHQSVGYEVVVPRSLWSAVFGPDEERPESLNWPEFLLSDVEQHGSFVVDIWFKVLSKQFPPEQPPWNWVIATVDDICEHEDCMRINGRAERFEPERFAKLVLHQML